LTEEAVEIGRRVFLVKPEGTLPKSFSFFLGKYLGPRISRRPDVGQGVEVLHNETSDLAHVPLLFILLPESGAGAAKVSTCTRGAVLRRAPPELVGDIIPELSRHGKKMGWLALPDADTGRASPS
jgi:hypothetical protein